MNLLVKIVLCRKIPLLFWMKWINKNLISSYNQNNYYYNLLNVHFCVKNIIEFINN